MTPVRDPKQRFFMNHEAPRRRQGGPRRHPGGTQEAPRDTQEAPRRHPEAPRRHPGGTQEARDILESKCVFSYAHAQKSDASDHFRVDGSDVTCTISAAGAQKLVNVGANVGRENSCTDNT